MPMSEATILEVPGSSSVRTRTCIRYQRSGSDAHCGGRKRRTQSYKGTESTRFYRTVSKMPSTSNTKEITSSPSIARNTQSESPRASCVWTPQAMWAFVPERDAFAPHRRDGSQGRAQNAKPWHRRHGRSPRSLIRPSKLRARACESHL